MTRTNGNQKRPLDYAPPEGSKRRVTSQLAITVYIVVGLLVVVVDAAAPYFGKWRAAARHLGVFQWVNVAEGMLWLSLSIFVAAFYRTRTATMGTG